MEGQLCSTRDPRCAILLDVYQRTGRGFVPDMFDSHILGPATSSRQTVDRPHFLSTQRRYTDGQPVESSHLDRGALEIYSRASVSLKLHQVQPFASPTAMNCGSGPRFSPQ